MVVAVQTKDQTIPQLSDPLGRAPVISIAAAKNAQRPDLVGRALANPMRNVAHSDALNQLLRLPSTSLRPLRAAGSAGWDHDLGQSVSN
jgi:hypothetical protein